jgi:hypothetical protein
MLLVVGGCIELNAELMAALKGIRRA